jgi:hypothetical protein
MSTIRRSAMLLLPVAALVIAAFILFHRGATAAPQVATGWFVSEGCYVYGDSWQVGSDINSATLGIAYDNSPCNWVYLNGDYYVYPNWYYDQGPAWSYEPTDGEFTYIREGATIATEVFHSGCDAGWPCSNWVKRWSYDN